MAKRQLRLKGKDLDEKLPEFSGQKINIVKKDQSVIYLYLDRLTDNVITGRNMRLANVQIKLSDIDEVIIDIKSRDAD